MGLDSPTSDNTHHTKYHDPEVDAKQATSAAGNYPYWGDLPREGEDQSSGPKHGSVIDDSREKQSSDTGATGAVQTAPSITTSSANRNAPEKHSSKKEEAAGAGLAGAAGATYLVSHEGRKHDANESSSKRDTPYTTTSQTQTPSKAYGPGYTATQTSETPTSDHYATRESSHKRDELALGTGAAGLAGAGYLASREKQHDTRDEAQAKKSPMYNTSSSGPVQSSTYESAAEPSQAYRPQDASSTDPYGTHNSGKKDGLALGAGAAGLAGAGYLASRNNDRSNEPSTSGGIHNTVVGRGSPTDPKFHQSYSTTATTVGPQQNVGIDQHGSRITGTFGAPKSGEDRDTQGLAAAAGVGAGAGLAAAEKHRYDQDKYYKGNESKHSASQAHKQLGESHSHHHDSRPAQSSSIQQPAQVAAAQQAWNKQDSTTDTRHDNNHRGAELATAGAGIAGVGATAAYYGQGKEHDQNPRSGESEKIAERASGGSSGGVPQAPSSQQHGHDESSGRKFNSMPGSFPAGASVGSGLSSHEGGGSRVVHKCHNCGVDNDISEYFKKDAAFRAGS